MIIAFIWFMLLSLRVRLYPRTAVSDYGHRRDDPELPVIWLSGGPYQRGFQHGALCHKELHAYQRVAWTYAAQTAVQRLGMPAWLASLLIRPLLILQAAHYLPMLTPNVRAEMQGLADGAGLHLADVLVNTAIWEIFGSLLGPSSGPLHCSEWAASARIASNGSLLGYNYDVIVPEDRSIIEPFLALFVVQDGTHTYTSVNTIGSIGLNTAVNAHGVAFGWDNSYLAHRSANVVHHVPFMLTLRELALNATSCRDAATRLQNVQRPQADMCVLADPEQVCVVELAGTENTRREADIVWSCNRLQGLAHLDYLGRGRAPDARHTRYPLLFQHMPHALTPHDVAQVLRDQGGESGRQIADGNTTFTVIYAPAEQRLWVAAGGAPSSFGGLCCYTVNGERLADDDIPPLEAKHSDQAPTVASA